MVFCLESLLNPYDTFPTNSPRATDFLSYNLGIRHLHATCAYRRYRSHNPEPRIALTYPIPLILNAHLTPSTLFLAASHPCYGLQYRIQISG